MCSVIETDVTLHQAFLPESHIPAKSAGHHRGMWSVDSEQREAYCTGWDMKCPHG